MNRNKQECLPSDIPEDRAADDSQKILYEIRNLAYDLYEKAGRMPGSEFDSWFQATRIVKSRRQT